MMLQIPNDCILMLSGMPCVGKTTTAYNIVNRFPEFRRVSELDIIRTVVRAVIKNADVKKHLDTSTFQERYAKIFDSISESNFATVKQQSTALLPYVQEIVNRQQMRKIPTIIEGSSIIPSTYFGDASLAQMFQEHIVFINLYLSDVSEHYRRRVSRCKEREYTDSEESIWQEIQEIREDKNLALHLETLALGSVYHNVFSIDIAHMSEDEVLMAIMQIMSRAISENF